MKLFQKLVCMALTATATASLSICAFAADYTFDTAADTDYYPSTSYEDTYGTAYHYGSKNLVDYQIPELPYGVLSTTQTGVMEKLRLPGLQQTVGRPGYGRTRRYCRPTLRWSCNAPVPFSCFLLFLLPRPSC